MTNKRELENKPIHAVSVGVRMLQGAGIGLILIMFFLIGAGEPDPGWSEFWMLKPLLMVPAAGALGGLFYFNMDHMRSMGGWRTVLAYLLSLVVYFIVLWLGTVLGLHGTMWD